MRVRVRSIKNRLQSASGEHTFLSIGRDIWRRDGLGGFYNGCKPSSARRSPQPRLTHTTGMVCTQRQLIDTSLQPHSTRDWNGRSRGPFATAAGRYGATARSSSTFISSL